MSKLAGLGSGGPVLGVIAVVVVAAVGGGLYFAGVFDADDPAAPAATQAAVTPDEVQPKPQADTEARQAAPDLPAEVAEVPLPDPPSIDTFRLEPDGSMIVAGQAHPDWDTSVVLDGVVLEQVSPDGQGKFVSFLTVESSNQPRILSLQMSDGQSGRTLGSIDEIIIAPVIADIATPEPTGTSQDDPAMVSAEQPDTGTAQAVLLADDTGVQVLQPAVPSDQPPEVMSSVALDAISYSPAGEVQLAGRGQGDGFVRVYLDNAPIKTLPIQDDGNWRADLPQVDTGVYTLRIDEVDGDGNVTSRVETPFKREDQAVIAEAAPTEARITAITVQPGSTLWAISRARYGDGVLYVRVFEANRDRIRNPDLIYPGQVFTLPE